MNKDLRYSILVRDSFTCQNCGKVMMTNEYGLTVPQIAHRIRQGKGTENFLKKININLTKNQIDAIINHPLNLVSTCSLKCNAAMNIFFNPIERDRLIKEIMEDLKIEG